MSDRGHARLVAWVATASVLTLTVYSNQLSILTSGLSVLLTQTLGTVFPAYPFLALMLLLTALRWKDFHKVLLAEKGVTSKSEVRLIGIILIVMPAAFWNILFDQAAQSVYLAMEVSALSLVLVAYGTMLAINPLMGKIMLPYASFYSIGLVSPLFLLDSLGAPMASFSSFIAGGMVNLLGIDVAWQGVSFNFVSSAGQPVSAVVTPACSAAYSISIYLALVGLMHLDMGSSLITTAKFAFVGLVVIPLLDSVRIATMIWFGFMDGPAAFWGIHDWLGYAIFFAFYIITVVIYSTTTSRASHANDLSTGPASMGVPISSL